MTVSKKTINFIIVSIYIITLFLGVNTFLNINIIDQIRRILIVALPAVICFLIIIENKKNIKNIFNKKIPIILYIATIIWFFLTFLFGIRTGIESLKGLIYFGVLLTLLIILFNVKFNEKDLNEIKRAIFLSFSLVMIIGIIQYIFQINLNTYNNNKYPGILGRINSTFYIATILDKYVIIMFPLITYELLKDKDNIFYKILLFLSMLGITFTFSRSGQSIYLVMCFIFFIVTLLKKQFKNSALICILVLIMILIPGTKYSVQSGFNFAYEKANVPKVLRLDLLKILGSSLKTDDLSTKCVDKDCMGDEEGSAFFRNYYENVGKAFIKEYPVFGIGVGNNSYLYNNQNAKDYLKNDSIISDQYGYMYPHSGYIQLTAETGYIGFSLFMLTLLSLFIIKIKNKDSNLDYYVLLLLLFAFLMGNITEGLFHSKQIMYLFIIFYGLYTNYNKGKKKSILISSFNADIGGIERSLISLLKNFNYNKYDITLVLEQKNGAYLSSIPSEVIIKEYKVSNNKNKLIRKTSNLLKKVIWNIMNYHNYSCSICYATYSLPCNFIASSSSKNRILFVHSNYKYIYKENDLVAFFNKRKINNYNHIIFVSNESKRDLINYFPMIKEKSIVINNLVDYKLILDESKENINIKKKKNTFLYVGRLDENSKQITRIIEVANKLKSQKNVEFWIIGDGKDRQTYLNLISKYKLNNILMLGSKNNPYPYIQNCDYLILTSNYEGFPVVYNEAIVLDKPILTTIDVSDDFISIKDRFGIIMLKDVDDIYKTINNVIKEKFEIKEKIDFNDLNKKRMFKLESLMEEQDG